MFKLPVSQPIEAKFKGQSSSAAYNRAMRERLRDITELYKESNEINNRLYEMNDRLLIENHFLHNELIALKEIVKEMEESLEQIESERGRTVTRAYVSEMQETYPRRSQDEADNRSRCRIDRHYNIATLPVVRTISKTNYYDETEERTFLPDELQIETSRTHNHGMIEENDIRDAFRYEYDAIWKRLVTYNRNDAPHYEDVVIDVTLPEQIAHHMKVNEISLLPFPEQSVRIMSFMIQKNGKWEDMTDLYHSDGSERKERIKWLFSASSVDKIRMRLRQDQGITTDDHVIYPIGLQDIQIHYVSYEDEGILLTPIEMKGLYTIEGVEHHFQNNQALSMNEHLQHLNEGQIFEYDVMVENAIGDLVPLRKAQWTNQDAQKLWIRTKLMKDPHNGTSPALESISVYYSRSAAP